MAKKKKKMGGAVNLPEGVSSVIDGSLITVKGPKGEMSKRLSDSFISIEVKDNIIILGSKRNSKREKIKIGSFRSHIRNMIKGVTEGHKYVLKICSGHFPMNVSVSKNEFIIKNFIGEKIPRTLEISDRVSVKVDGDNVIVESIDKNAAGQTAASIETLTRRPGFDKRIFQDGLYITSKDGKEIK